MNFKTFIGVSPPNLKIEFVLEKYSIMTLKVITSQFFHLNTTCYL